MVILAAAAESSKITLSSVEKLVCNPVVTSNQFGVVEFQVLSTYPCHISVLGVPVDKVRSIVLLALLLATPTDKPAGPVPPTQLFGVVADA